MNTSGRPPTEEEHKEAVERAKEFKKAHLDLFEKLADNEGHSVIAVHREEAEPEFYEDDFLMHPTAKMVPRSAREKARELVEAGNNIYTARPIVCREAQLAVAQEGLRVEFIDHWGDGSINRITVDEYGQVSEPFRDGFYETETEIVVDLFKYGDE